MGLLEDWWGGGNGVSFQKTIGIREKRMPEAAAWVTIF
jgi:hypothetical protein